MGVAVRTRRHSYRAGLCVDLSCVAEAQIFCHCDPDIYLSGVSDIFRLRRLRQVSIARAVPRARHHRAFEFRDHPRMEAAEDFRCSGKALEFDDGHEVAKIAEFPCPTSMEKASGGSFARTAR